jgi:hypothetical protein
VTASGGNGCDKEGHARQGLCGAGETNVPIGQSEHKPARRESVIISWTNLVHVEILVVMVKHLKHRAMEAERNDRAVVALPEPNPLRVPTDFGAVA